MELILEDIHFGIEDFRIVVVLCCVWGTVTLIGQHISNMQIICQLSARNERSILP